MHQSEAKNSMALARQLELVRPNHIDNSDGMAWETCVSHGLWYILTSDVMKQGEPGSN